MGNSIKISLKPLPTQLTMTKRTKKVGIARKYGVRYGSSLRKLMKKFETMQRQRYVCPFCGKATVRKVSVGIWRCRACKKIMAGGAWSLTTSVAVTARITMARLKKKQEVNEQ